MTNAPPRSMTAPSGASRSATIAGDHAVADDDREAVCERSGSTPSTSRRFVSTASPRVGSEKGHRRARDRHASASTIGRNFTRVSSSSASGSLPATMPAPACARSGMFVAIGGTRRGRTARSAGRSPIRRRRSHRPTPPGRRSGRDRTARAGGSPRVRHPSAFPATAAVGCSAATRSRAEAPPLSSPSTSVARWKTLGSFRRERLLARGQDARVRAQRGQHALHRVEVLVLILRARRQREGCRGIGIRVGTARRRPGQHARRDRPARDGDEGLGTRADDPVDRVCPAVGVAGRQRPDEPAQIRARAARSRRDRARGPPCSTSPAAIASSPPRTAA